MQQHNISWRHSGSCDTCFILLLFEETDVKSLKTLLYGYESENPIEHSEHKYVRSLQEAGSEVRCEEVSLPFGLVNQ